MAVKGVVFGDGTAGFFKIVAQVEGGHAVLGAQQAVAVAIVGVNSGVGEPGHSGQFVFGVKGLGVGYAVFGAKARKLGFSVDDIAILFEL